MENINLEHGHFYWIKLGQVITVGQYDAIAYRTCFDIIGSDERFYLGIDVFDDWILEEIHCPFCAE